MLTWFILFTVANANENPPCDYWGDRTQEARNRSIAEEASRQYILGAEPHSKIFVRNVLEIASEEAATLPTYTYDYHRWYTSVDFTHIDAGHVIQVTAPRKQTVIVVDVGANGWIDIIGPTRETWHLPSLDVIYRVYEIGTGMCSKE